MRSGRQVSRLILQSQFRTLTRSNTLHHALRTPQTLQIRTFSKSIQRYQQAEALETPVESDISTFQDLQGIVHQNVLDSIITDMGLSNMTEVQQKTLKEALTGNDM
jgi:hypothetical protein